MNLQVNCDNHSCVAYKFVLTFQEKLASVEQAIETAKSHKRHYEQKMKEHNKKIADKKKEYEKYKKELEVCMHM